MATTSLKQLHNELSNLFLAWRYYLDRDIVHNARLRGVLISSGIGLSAMALAWALQFFIRNTAAYAQGEPAATSSSVSLLGVFPSWLMGGSIVSIVVGFARRKYSFFKRCFDFSVAAGSLLVFSPLFLIIWFLVKIDSDGPVFFKQTRLGKDGKLFEIWKFRTMRNNAEFETGPVWTEDDDPRVTRIGQFLRKSHLDELPQLLNILRGDMSLIGPRPERPEFMKAICAHIPHFNKRLNIRPGITGLAQTRYHYGASLKDAARKLRYDALYIKKQCWLLDFQIILWTVGRILTGEGAR
jgi:lipopolysaccharide/colanic/teichoic acid biosynthesis glycosyltransferase